MSQNLLGNVKGILYFWSDFVQNSYWKSVLEGFGRENEKAAAFNSSPPPPPAPPAACCLLDPAGLLLLHLTSTVHSSCRMSHHNASIEHTARLTCVIRKQTLKVFVVVIPKEGWARVASLIIFSKSRWLAKRRMVAGFTRPTRAHPSFCMTTTKTLRSVFL